ncbi:MAG: hypothetical protein K6T29_07070, partial [Peptococcaceae bacterium]|nr:hypothetical protein [Peptococcaceae bacterium]
MAGPELLPLILPAAVPPDPVWIFERLEGPQKTYSFVLESALLSDRLGRYSWVGIDPFLVLESKDGRVRLSWDGREKSFRENPFAALDGLLKKHRMPPAPAPVPFWGGAVGFFSYDLGRQIEALPAAAEDDTGVPDLVLGFYDTVVAVDHFTGAVYICSTGLPARGAEAAGRAARRAAEVAEKLGASTGLPVNGRWTGGGPAEGADRRPPPPPPPPPGRGGGPRGGAP